MPARTNGAARKADRRSPEHSLAGWLAVAASARGWSNGELARRLQPFGLELPAQSIRRTLNGERTISLDEAIAYADLFDVGLEDMLEEAAARDHVHAMQWTPPVDQPGGGTIQHGRCRDCHQPATRTTTVEIAWQ